METPAEELDFIEFVADMLYITGTSLTDLQAKVRKQLAKADNDYEPQGGPTQGTENGATVWVQLMVAYDEEEIEDEEEKK